MLHRRASTDVAAPPARLYDVVCDLATYPRWLGIVVDAQPEPSPAAEPAWAVDLGARLGPLRRTKRLRMVRTVAEPALACRFERRERDGRDHSPWTLAVRLDGDSASTRVSMELDYGGRLWLPGLELVLDGEIRSAGRRLAEIVES